MLLLCLLFFIQWILQQQQQHWCAIVLLSTAFYRNQSRSRVSRSFSVEIPRNARARAHKLFVCHNHRNHSQLASFFSSTNCCDSWTTETWLMGFVASVLFSFILKINNGLNNNFQKEITCIRSLNRFIVIGVADIFIVSHSVRKHITNRSLYTFTIHVQFGFFFVSSFFFSLSIVYDAQFFQS